VFNPAGFELGSANKTRTGWTVGGGSEWKFAPNWSVFLEYDFADFGSRSLTVVGPAGVGDTITAKSNLQMFLIGLNWRPKF
jgi:outer membrane immunogenic protein